MMFVVDTNIFVICLSSRSNYHKIYLGLLKGAFHIAISNDILMEYNEILSKKYSPQIAEAFVELLIELPNVYLINVYYNWDLIAADKSDNNFVDCAISSAADYLATEDNHFNILRQIDFPKVNLINVDEFLALL